MKYLLYLPFTYVNHTFTSHLALSAPIQPYAGFEKDLICEYPVEPKFLALDITKEKFPEQNRFIKLPEKPGLVLTVDTENLKNIWLMEKSASMETLFFKNLYCDPEIGGGYHSSPVVICR